MSIELRHLRCFVVLAEELHFTRAAERLHVEQSPLSRTIKELEQRIGVQLFRRNRRGTHLIRAGAAFLPDARRALVVFEQALEGAKAMVDGHFNIVHVAISDGITQINLASLLARYRQEEPTNIIRLSEVTLAEQLRGLNDETYNIGFARTNEVSDSIVAVPLWQEALVVALPTRHPLLAYPTVPLETLLRHPLIICKPGLCEGYHGNIERILRTSSIQPNIVEYATSLDMLLTLVTAGYGAGFVTTTQINASYAPEVVTRPLSMENSSLITYLLHKAGSDMPKSIATFIDRAIFILGDQISHKYKQRN